MHKSSTKLCDVNSGLSSSPDNLQPKHSLVLFEDMKIRIYYNKSINHQIFLPTLWPF